MNAIQLSQYIVSLTIDYDAWWIIAAKDAAQAKAKILHRLRTTGGCSTWKLSDLTAKEIQ